MIGKSHPEISPAEYRKISLPVVLVEIVICLSMVLYGAFVSRQPLERFLNLSTGVIGVLFVVVYFFFIFPQLARNPFYIWVVLVVNSLSTAWIFTIQRFTIPGIAFLAYAVFIFGTSVLTNRWITYTIVATSIIGIFSFPPLAGYSSQSIEWTNLLSVLLIAIAAVETIHQLKQSIRKQIRRLEAANRMSRSLVSSIEISQVVNSMSSAIQSVLGADTYYIGLIQGDQLHLELFYDDGELFNDVNVSLDDSLVGWVYKNRRSLLLGNLPEDIQKLKIGSTSTIGKPKLSLSWMGAPLQTHTQLYGMVAVASYAKNQFDRSDLELLENFASQSAITLDNAYHHAEVEHKSTIDSLTGALNHGHFISALENEIQKALTENYSINLIMLDIDYFKRYNDTFGHLVGDRVLVGLVDTIRRHLKSSDLVGRWGGEEFAVALISTNPHQAHEVARRIRLSLRELNLVDRNGAAVYAPTVSQGIAIFPQEAQETFGLIDLADQRLYLAKDRGWDQVETSSHPL